MRSDNMRIAKKGYHRESKTRPRRESGRKYTDALNAQTPHHLWICTADYMPRRIRRLPAVCSRPRKPAREPLHLAKQPEGERSQLLPVFNSKNNTKITVGGHGPGSMWCSRSPSKDVPKLQIPPLLLTTEPDFLPDHCMRYLMHTLQSLLLYLSHNYNTSEDT